MKTIKEDISKLTAVGNAGAGMVSITISGEYKVLKIDIADVLIDKTEKEMLSVMIMSAFNDAADKMRVMIEDYTKRQATKFGLQP